MKISSIPGLLLVSFFLSTALSAQNTLKRAEKEFEIGAFEKAVFTYKEILAGDPANLEANTRIADCYRYLNQLEQAQMHYENAVSKPGVSEATVFQYGLVLQGLGRYEQARQIFERLAADAPAYTTRARQFSEACKFAMGADAPSAFKVTNEFINTAESDFGPAFFGKDKVVYVSARKDISIQQTRVAAGSQAAIENMLLVTERDKNGFLRTPSSLHNGFGAQFNEGPIAYNPSGNTVAITRNNFRNGVRQIPHQGLELTLYLAEAGAGGSWQGAKAFIHNGAGFSTGYPCFSPDGRSLFFASDRPGGYGGFDIYVSYRTGASWSTPENLGPAINTIGNEITPFFDGSAVYFASDYHKGFGGFDLFRAEQNGGKWSTVYHLGNGINSSADDYGFLYDALRNIGYIVSNRPGGKGLEDIYRVTKEADNLVFKVVDAANGKPVAGATIDFANCGEGSFQTSASGVFTMQVLKPLNCVAVVKMAGYRQETIDLQTLSLRANRTVEVAIVNESASYEGRVIDQANGMPIPEVRIMATNRATNEQTIAIADGRGAYLLALQPNASYTIRYSKQGFRDVSQTLAISPQTSRRLDDIGIMPVDAPVRSESPSVQPTATTVKSAPASAPTMVNGFAVQLAAVATPPDLLSIEKKLGVNGSLYVVRDGKINKVRLGVFPDREAAVVMLDISKQQGFTGAFIVQDIGSPVPAPQPVAGTASVSKAAKNVVASPPALRDGFAIQLAAYSNLQYFDQSKVSGLGEIQTLPKGELTAVLLTGFDSRSSAELALRKAKANGFTGAYLVQVINGQVQKAN